MLHGDAEEQDVGGRRVPEQRGGNGDGVEEPVVRLPGHLGHPAGECLQRGVVRRRVGDHRTRRRAGHGADDHGARLVGADAVRVARRHQEIERQQAVDARAVGVVGRRHGAAAAHPQIADHRPGLLRQAGLIEAAHDLAVEHRRSAEHLADRDHAGPADPREAHGERIGRHDRLRRRQPDGWILGRPDGRACRARRVLVDRDGGERRTVALQARHVEVAARLVDPRLAPVRRVDRLHRQAVALVPAVAAALADPLVDDHAEAGLGPQPAAARPALLRRALLIVQQHRHAGHGRQLDLRLHQHRAVTDRHAPLARAGRSPCRATCPVRRT